MQYAVSTHCPVALHVSTAYADNVPEPLRTHSTALGVQTPMDASSDVPLEEPLDPLLEELDEDPLEELDEPPLDELDENPSLLPAS